MRGTRRDTGLGTVKGNIEREGATHEDARWKDEKEGKDSKERRKVS